MANISITSVLTNAASVMDGKALSQAIDLSNDCVHLAWACVIGAGISMLIMAFAKTPKDVANSAADTAKTLAEHADLAPASIDIPKVIDAAKGVIEALTKASPLLVWMAAAVFFMGIGMFGVSNYAQQHPDRDICTESQTPTTDTNGEKQFSVSCAKKGDTPAPRTSDTHTTETGNNQRDASHTEPVKRDEKPSRPIKQQ